MAGQCGRCGRIKGASLALSLVLLARIRPNFLTTFLHLEHVLPYRLPELNRMSFSSGGCSDGVSLLSGAPHGDTCSLDGPGPCWSGSRPASTRRQSLWQWLLVGSG